MSEKSHLDHVSPLRWLSAHLHKGRTLRERVVKLRWKRKRATPAPMTIVSTPATISYNDDILKP